jgi:hypothetical protein
MSGSPRVAMWLMERFGVEDGLIGDLLEESGARRSAWWLWRQTVVAIGRTAATAVRHHKLLALRAILVGWIAQLALRRLPFVLMPYVGWGWTRSAEIWLHDRFGFPVIPITFLMLMAASACAAGFVVARTHRRHAMPMLLAFIASLLIFQTAGFVNSFDRGLRSFGAFGLFFNSLFPFLVVPACVFAGGLLSGAGGRQDRGPAIQRQRS